MTQIIRDVLYNGNDGSTVYVVCRRDDTHGKLTSIFDIAKRYEILAICTSPEAQDVAYRLLSL